MRKHFRLTILILTVLLLCICMLGCSGKRYYQYTGASMTTYDGLVTTLKQHANEGDIFILQSPASTTRTAKDGTITKFVGWQIKGDDEIHSAGEQFTMGKKNIIFQAVWKTAYKVTFTNTDSAVTGDLPTLSDTHFTEGETIKLPECKLVKENYTFGGWKTSDGNIYNEHAEFTMPAKDVTFTATWTNVYNLTFLSGADNEEQVTGDAPTLSPREIGASVYLPKCTFSYAGYEFICWVSNGVEYPAGATYQVTGHATFTAKWQKSSTTSTEKFDFTLLEDNTYAISKSSTLTTALTGNLVLPATFNDCAVTIIKENAFKNTSIESVTIPASIKVIEENAFANATKLFSVIFESDSQLVKIEENAFLNCGKLATFGDENTTKNNAVMPTALTEIEDKAFYGCAFRAITLNANLQTLGEGVFAKQLYLAEFISNTPNFKGNILLTDANENTLYAFAYTSSDTVTINTTTVLPYTFSYAQITSLNIGKKVTTIEEYAFEYCSSLTAINYDANNSITTIEDCAFLGCDLLTKVFVGKTIQNLSKTAFDGCLKIKEYEVDEENPYFCSYGGNLYNKNKTVLLAFSPDNESPYCFLPETVTTISESAFAYSKVEEVFISNTDENHKITIEDKAFYSCYFLKIISFWDKIETIGDRAFQYCRVMDSAILGNSLVELGQYAFCYCEKLKNLSISDNSPLITIPQSAFANCAITSFDTKGKIQTIERNAFSACSNMTKIKLDGVLEIAFGAFSYCTQLKTVEIPATLTTLAGGAFNDAYSAITFTVAEGNANFSAQEGTLFNKDKTTLILVARNKASDVFVLPQSVKNIAPYAFYGTEVTAIDASNSALEDIGAFAFAECSKLTSVKVPATLKYIRANAFEKCLLLANFEFLDKQGNKTEQNLVKIEEYAFKNCIRLKFYMLGNNLPIIDENAFYLEPAAQESTNQPRIYVNADMLEEIKLRIPAIAKYLQVNE